MERKTYKPSEMRFTYDDRINDNYFVIESGHFKNDPEGWEKLIDIYFESDFNINDKGQWIVDEKDISDVKDINDEDELVEFLEKEVRDIRDLEMR